MQEIQQTADFTRYKFEHYENRHIVDLNRDNEIVAYYINNNLQNRSFLETDEYAEQVKRDLAHQFFINGANLWNNSTGNRTLTGRGGCGPGAARNNTSSSRRSSTSYTGLEWREYNHLHAEYYSRNGRCYQRGGKRKRNWFLWHKWTGFARNGIITELDPASGHCPTNRTLVLNYRQNPLLFFRPDTYTDIDSAGRRGSANQNFVSRGFTTVWYLTDEYIESGWWMEEEDLADLMLFYNAHRIKNLLENSEWAENITLERIGDSAPDTLDIIINAAVKRIISKSIEKILKRKLSQAVIKNINWFVSFLITMQEIYSEIRASLEIPRLTDTSDWNEGWILTRDGPGWWNLNTDVSPRSW